MIKSVPVMKNLADLKTLREFSNKFVAYGKDKVIIASGKTYSELNKNLPANKRKNIEVTFISPSKEFIAP